MKQKKRTIKKHSKKFFSLHKLLDNMKVLLEIAKVIKEIISMFW